MEQHWSVLPNLARLRNQGSFSRLGTTMPPQSPVAWTTFITGLEPAAHGIFDFVYRVHLAAILLDEQDRRATL
ncbi:MAG: alkaline phosphatase family protein [Bryobacteraceae bacterium]